MAGGWPSIDISRSTLRSSRGTELTRPMVYGCCGLLNSSRTWRGLDDLARVHHRHAIAHAGHDAEVVADEDHRDVRLALHVLQQRQVLRLDGRVQRRRRLVGDDQLGHARDRDAADDALAHAAAHLVRVVLQPLARRRDAQQAQRLGRLVPQRLAADRC